MGYDTLNSKPTSPTHVLRSNWTFVLRVLLGLAVKRGWLALLGPLG